MTWFTETPWPPIVILVIAACAMLAVWSAQKRGAWLLGALGALVVAVGVYFVEQAVVTDAERVEQAVVRLADDFRRKDRDATLAYFSQQAPEWRAQVSEALDLVDLHPDLDIKDMHVRLFAEGSRAVARFRANGTVSFRGMDLGWKPSLWELTWQKEGGQWKIIDVQRLDPINEQRIGVFDPRGG